MSLQRGSRLDAADAAVVTSGIISASKKAQETTAVRTSEKKIYQCCGRVSNLSCPDHAPSPDTGKHVFYEQAVYPPWNYYFTEMKLALLIGA